MKKKIKPKLKSIRKEKKSEILVRSYKVYLKPNNKQRTKFFQFAGAARYAYNWTIEYEEKFKKEKGYYELSDINVRKEFTKFKKEKKNRWMYKISNNVFKQAIKDCINAYRNYIDKISYKPKYKSRDYSQKSFYVDTAKIKIIGTHVKIESIANNKKKNRQVLNWIRLIEKDRIPYGKGVKYLNPRIKFDGLNWYLAISIKMEEKQILDNTINNFKTEGIGIDLGIKSLAVTSKGIFYGNINKTSQIKRLKKRIKKKQKKMNHQLLINNQQYLENGKFKKGCGKSLFKSKQREQIRKEKCKLEHRFSSIREQYQHLVINDILLDNPEFVTIEDLNIKGLMRNKYLSKSIQEQTWYRFRLLLKYKCKIKEIELRIANRFYASSKRCSICGNKKPIRLDERTYCCNNCGLIIDRDLNASINLKNY